MKFLPVSLTLELAEFTKQVYHKPLMGLDVGTKTIGIALVDPGWRVATPYETLKRIKFSADAAQLQSLIAARNIGGLVIGLPLMLDGRIDKKAQSCKSFALNLSRLADWILPIMLWDERLSTKAAERTLIGVLDQTRSKRAKLVDQLAASFILQGAVDAMNHHLTHHALENHSDHDHA